MHYDKLSLIYENSLRPNIVREDVLESYFYLIEVNKNTEAQYYLENILTSAEIQVLIEQGFLNKIGQGVKKFAKKAAPYAAAGLMAAGGVSKGETPISQQMDYLKGVSDRMAQVSQNVGDVMGNNKQQTPFLIHTLVNQIKYIDKVENHTRAILKEVQRSDKTLENPQIENVKNIQDIRVKLIEIENFLQNENELRIAEKKPELKVPVDTLNQIMSKLGSLKFNDDLRTTIGNTTQLIKLLNQEVLKIEAQISQ